MSLVGQFILSWLVAGSTGWTQTQTEAEDDLRDFDKRIPYMGNDGRNRNKSGFRFRNSLEITMTKTHNELTDMEERIWAGTSRD